MAGGMTRRRAKGEGSVYWDGSRGRWVGAVEVGLNPLTGGRRRARVIGKSGESRSSVTARLRERVAAIEESSPGAPETVGELVSMWRTRAAPKRKSESTLAMTDSLIANHIEPVLGHVSIEAVTVETIEAFLDARAGSHSKSTLDKMKTVLAQSYDFGIRRRHVTWNPARVAELPTSAGPTREPRALLAGEARGLLNVVLNPRTKTDPKTNETTIVPAPRLGAWCVVCLTLGMRPGEVSGLVWEAIDFDAGTLTVYQALGKRAGEPLLKPTKTKRSRTLDMPEVTAMALREHRRRCAEERLMMGDEWPARWSSLVFTSESGTPLDAANVRRLVRSMAVEAGIEGTVTPYDLRHTATSLISAGGLSAERLADLLGHKDTRMVFDHYRHPVTASVSTAAEYWGAQVTQVSQ